MVVESSPDVRFDALRMLSNGVYILTACEGGTLHAASVSWVSQVSFEPPLVMTALRRNSLLARAIGKAHRFALNILENEQDTLAQTFFEHFTAPADAELTTDLAGHGYRLSPAHCPLLVDALAWLECRVAAEAASPGDHYLILSEVTGTGIRRQGTPMVLWDTPWSYGGLRAT